MDEVVTTSIGRRIRQARQSAGLSQPELSRQCGWDSQSRVSNYELDVRRPDFESLRAIARVTGYRWEWLLSGDGLECDDAMPLAPGSRAVLFRTAPIVGTITVNPDGTWADDLMAQNEDEVGYVETFSEDEGVYVVRARGQMLPRPFGDEWLVEIEPNITPQPGEPVRLRANDGTRCFAELLWMTEERVAVMTLGAEPHQLRFRRDEIEILEAVGAFRPPSRARTKR